MRSWRDASSGRREGLWESDKMRDSAVGARDKVKRKSRNKHFHRRALTFSIEEEYNVFSKRLIPRASQGESFDYSVRKPSHGRMFCSTFGREEHELLVQDKLAQAQSGSIHITLPQQGFSPRL